MKIIFVNRFFYPDHSATSQILTDLCFDLAEGGHAVHVVTSRQLYEDPGAALPAAEVVQGVTVHRVWTSRFGRSHLGLRGLDYLTFYFGAASCLLRLVRRGDIVIAKTDPPLISVVASVAARIKQAQLINWLQDLFPEVAIALGMRRVGPAAAMLRYLRNRSLHAAVANVAIGDTMRQRLLAEGIAPTCVTVIHNWADGKEITPAAGAADALRSTWELFGRFVIGYSGNMGRAHEFGTVIEAAGRLKSNAEVGFLFIGGGAYREWLEQEAARRGLTNIAFRPYQPRAALSASLAVPDIHLISLRPELEGCIVPSKFYGVAAAGRPTLFVGDEHGEIPRLLHAGGCGYTVAIGDAAALAARIGELAANRPLCEEMGRRARRMFEDHFDRSSAVAAWREVLRHAGASEENHDAGGAGCNRSLKP